MSRDDACTLVCPGRSLFFSELKLVGNLKNVMLYLFLRWWSLVWILSWFWYSWCCKYMSDNHDCTHVLSYLVNNYSDNTSNDFLPDYMSDEIFRNKFCINYDLNTNKWIIFVSLKVLVYFIISEWTVSTWLIGQGQL